MQPFLRNTWYVAAWSEECGDTSVARTILEVPILLVRASDGRVHAMEDMCPHRFAPLSLGRRVGDEIECGYHGLRFDTAGRCTYNPFATATPRAARVRVFPVEERYGAVWLWLGDPEYADDTRIPDLSFLADETGRTVRTVAHVGAHYELGMDNLLDLSHIQFLHPTTFGNDMIAGGRHKVRKDGEVFHSDRFSVGGRAPAGFEQMMPTGGRPVDLWHDMRWHAPATMALDTGITFSGRPRDEGVHIMVAHILTPETLGTTHYFLATTRWTAIDSFHVDRAVMEINSKAIEQEDVPMLEAVQRRMRGRDLASMQPVLLPGDEAAVRVRRHLGGLIANEAALAPA